MRGGTNLRIALAWLPALALVGGTAAILWLQIPQHLSFRQAFFASAALLAASLALIAVLQGGPWWPRAMLATRAEVAGFLLVLAAGTGMRVADLGSFPPPDGQVVEEAQMGAGGYAAAHRGSLDAFFPLPTLAAEVGFRLFGQSMTALRLPFVALGVLSVPLFFVASRLFFASYAAALFATGIFATNAFLAGSSRVALESMSPIVTTCFALAATFYACVRRHPFSGALAGFANGLVFLEYFSYKLVPVPAAFLLLSRWLQECGAPYCNAVGSPYRWATLRRALGPLSIAALFGVAALATVVVSDRNNFAPVLEGYLRHRIDFDSRPLPPAEAVSEAASRVARSARFVFGSGGGSDVLPMSMGLLDPVTGWLAVAALLWCAIGGRRCPAKRFLVLAAALYVVLSGVLVALPTRYRLIPLIPYACLAAGVIVDDLVARLPDWRRAVGAASLATLLALGALNVHRFFGVAVHDREVLAQFNNPELEIGSQLGALEARDPQATVYLLSNRAYFGTVNDYFFLYDYDRVKVVATSDALEGKRGFLLTHTPFIDGTAALPGLRDCRRWHTRDGALELMTCVLSSERSSAPNPEETSR